ncbi:respiratory nitrate reductase subunit alpha [Klebsiella michiganensis]|nr:respiratory nitrate reductase subunit alpha [Klebsiella michiganensis]
MLRAADLVDALGQETNPEWKTVAFDEKGEITVPNGSIGSAGATKASGIWNSATAKPVKTLSCA